MSNRSENKVLTENFIAVTLTQIISYVIPLVSLPYLARVLGAEKFGLVFWAQATIQYYMILTDFGFGLSAVKEVSVNRDNQDKINQIVSSVFCIKSILILISFALLILFIALVPKFRSEWLLFCLTFFMVIGNAYYPIWYFQGIEHMKYITFFNIVSKSIFLCLIFIFVKQPSDYILVAILNSLGFIVAGILSIYIANKRFNLNFVIPSKEEIIYQFKNSSMFFLSRVAGAGVTNTNTFIIGLISNPLMVAYYVAADKIFNAMNLLAQPINQVLYPFVARNQDVKKFKKIFYFSLIFLAGMSVLMFIFAKYFITIFFGTELIEAYKVLRIFCITVLFSFVSALIGYPFIAALGHQKEANTSVIYGSIFHILCLVILLITNRINIYFVAFLTVLTEGLILLYRIISIKKYKLWNR